MTTETRQVSVYLPVALAEAIEREARESDRSVSYVIRKALEQRNGG